MSPCSDCAPACFCQANTYGEKCAFEPGPLLDEAGSPWRILEDCWCANCKEARKRLEARGWQHESKWMP